MINELPANYLTEGLIDFEYKKYILLAYLQHVSRHFDEQKLYPFLSDLIFHYQSLLSFRQTKERVAEHFPKRVKRIDLDNFRIEYERLMHDQCYLSEIEAILDYALPRLKGSVEEGTEIYEFVSQHIAIEPVGILPLNTDEGYLLLNNGDTGDMAVFGYAISLFESPNEKYRSLRTAFVQTYQRQFSHTFEGIKLDLIKQFRQLPNPATFAVSSRYVFPIQETLLPVAKRSLMRLLAQRS